MRKWDLNKINRVSLELSNNCNALCPMCPRHLMGTVRKFDKHEFSVEQFKKWFPVEFMHQINDWLYCGSRGDPIMCKDIVEIVEYTKESNPHCGIYMNTNGGARNAAFWTTLGKLLSTQYRDTVVFSIDGLEDTNHLYRRYVNWHHVMENARNFIDAGGQATWEFLVFEHNEHQLEEAEQLANRMGFKHFVPKKALGFDATNSTPVYSRSGEFEYFIKPPRNASNRNSERIPDVPGTVYTDLSGILKFDSEWEDRLMASPITDEMLKSDADSVNLQMKTVECKSLTERSQSDNLVTEIFIRADATVSPCCYVDTGGFFENGGIPEKQLQLRMRTFGLDKFNINKTSLTDIVDNLNLLYADNWEGDLEVNGKMLLCARTCSKFSAINTIFTHDKDSRGSAMRK